MIDSDNESLSDCEAKARRGSAEYQWKVGTMLREGRETEKDSAKAADWFQKAADQGHAGAMNDLGVHYLRGVGVELDVDRAFQLFAEAAEKDDPHAQCNIGDCYIGGQGVAKDESMGLEWIKKAADASTPVGQWSLGTAYMEGKGVTRDEAEAVKWFRRAASQDFPPAKFALAQAYETGAGVKPNLERAEKWYGAVQHINPEAAAKLADLYISGRGQTAWPGNSEADGNERSAIRYWRIAAWLGHEASKGRLSELGFPLNCCDSCRWWVECPLRDSVAKDYGEIPDDDFSTCADWDAKDAATISGPLMSIVRDSKGNKWTYRVIRYDIGRPVEPS